jgi:hypothetical protein
MTFLNQLKGFIKRNYIIKKRNFFRSFQVSYSTQLIYIFIMTHFLGNLLSVNYFGIYYPFESSF